MDSVINANGKITHVVVTEVWSSIWLWNVFFRFEISLLSILCMLISRMEMGTSRVSGDSDIIT